ncbi:LysR family transcriptional regulator [Methylocapsa polymorpha]|uniref:LysR family transcriptional regulator n=1 Tax=Methylocapsa polymorpha TaxID=3080828 RepID=A0ABZ0HTY4_9HYPH|nr:LysR family transcriptional regulator [Methylocapsa sp. RX1]
MSDRIRSAALNWEDLRYFIALARHGSLSAVARALRVNHATVARHVASLERTLSQALFERRADGYILTSDGRAVLEAANLMDEAALAVERHCDRSDELKGRVRLTLARVLADGFLIDRLGGVHERYPSLDLELIIESKVLSLANREADVALRFGRPVDSGLVARRVARIGFAFYASPKYRDRIAGGETPALIGYDEDSAFIAEATWMARRFGDARFSFRSNSQVSQAAAARAGFGVALLPRYLAGSDARLVELSFGELPADRDIWLLIRPDLTKIPRVKAVTDFLIDLFWRETKLLVGGG